MVWQLMKAPTLNQCDKEFQLSPLTSLSNSEIDFWGILNKLKLRQVKISRSLKINICILKLLDYHLISFGCCQNRMGKQFITSIYRTSDSFRIFLLFGKEFLSKPSFCPIYSCSDSSRLLRKRLQWSGVPRVFKVARKYWARRSSPTTESFTAPA